MRYLPVAYCIVYLLVSLFFYHVIWAQLWSPHNPSVLMIQGETPVYEFVAEQVRLNILSGNNPFASTDRVLYPMGWNISMEDIAPINGFIFLVLRPFLSIHQSFILIMLMSVFVSNITMYWLLRVLKISRSVAFITGLIYGFAPIVSYRIAGHPTYIALYLFTLPAIFFILLYQAKTTYWRLIHASLLGLSGVLMLLTNLYFLIMFVLLVGVWTFFCFIFHFKKTTETILSLYRPLVFAAIGTILLLIPWILEFIENARFNPRSSPQGFADSTAFSADIFGMFWPRHVILYKSAVEFIINKFAYAPFFESYTYYGILLLIPTVLFLRFRKKISPYLLPVYASALVLLVFTLGPFLKIGTIQTSIPLPYIVLHYLPYIQMARAPGRFIVPFVFMMCIVFAFLLQYVIKKYPQKQWLIVSVLFVIFLFDQRIYISPPLQMPVPNKIYSYLQDKPASPLLEIPFTIRDGLKNHGHMHSVWSMQQQFQHDHPLFGIYAGRVPDPQFAYFQTHPFFGPLGKLISIDEDPRIAATQITQPQLKSSSDFFDLQYVLLKEKESYSTYAAELIEPQFERKMRDNGYALYHRKSKDRTRTTRYRFSSEDTQGILQEGWSTPEKEGRWAVDARSTLYLNAKKGASKLVFKAHSLAEDQQLTVYINKHKIANLTITTEPEIYTAYVAPDQVRDLNMIQFIPTRKVVPSELDTASKDNRALSIFYSAIHIE